MSNIRKIDKANSYSGVEAEEVCGVCKLRWEDVHPLFTCLVYDVWGTLRMDEWIDNALIYPHPEKSGCPLPITQKYTRSRKISKN